MDTTEDRTPSKDPDEWLERFEAFGRQFHAAAICMDSFSEPCLAFATAQTPDRAPNDLRSQVGVALVRHMGTRREVGLVPRPCSQRLMTWVRDDELNVMDRLFGFWDERRGSGARQAYEEVATVAGIWLAFNLGEPDRPQYYTGSAEFWTCFVLDQCQYLPAPPLCVVKKTETVLVRLLTVDLIAASVVIVEEGAKRARGLMGNG